MLDKRIMNYNHTLPENYKLIFKEAKVELLEPYQRAFSLTKAKCLNCNNIWDVRPRMVIASYNEHRTNSCPSCARKKLSSSKKKSYKIYHDLFDSANVKPLEEYKGFRTKTLFKCLNCNNTWTTTIQVIKQSWTKYKRNGCPYCNKNNKEQKLKECRQKVFEDIRNKNVVVLTKDWNGERHYNKAEDGKIEVKNLTCGHVFRVTPCNLLYRNVTCPICGLEQRIKELRERNIQRGIEIRSDKEGWELYKALVEIETKKTYQQYKEQLNPEAIDRSIRGYHLDHIVSKAVSFKYDVPPEVVGHVSNLRLVPADYNRSKSYRVDYIPYVFHDYISYINRMELLFERIEHFTKAKFNKIEIGDDYFVYEHQNKIVGIIPIDGSFSNEKYYFSKLKNELRKRYDRVFFIFEDEFEKIDIITNKIKYFFNKKDEFKIIPARKLIIKIIDSNTKREFLNQTHLQGDDNFATINIGGFYNNELVTVMTFCKPRVLLGHKERKNLENVWELSRFASKTQTIIQGGASKLLSYFEKEYKPNKIISYGDVRYVDQTNNVYEKILNFRATKINPPGYYYVVNGKRYHRWGFRKDVLKTTLENFDPTKTEEENLLSHGVYRVWNCGTITFVKEFINNNK